MKQREEDDDAAYTVCEKCGQLFERAALIGCSFCSRRFCNSCAVRIAGKNYCSRHCWELMFFGDAEAEDREEGAEDED